jgi:hypothetical protein
MKSFCLRRHLHFQQ